MFGIHFSGRVARADNGVQVGEVGASASDNFGVGFKISGCSFSELNKAVRTEGNIWCLHGDGCFFVQNNIDVEYAGTYNAGENMSWRNTAFVNSYQKSIHILSGLGFGVSFFACSFDYPTLNTIHLAGSGAKVDFYGCWFEISVNTPMITEAVGETGNLVGVYGGTYVNASATTFSATLIDDPDINAKVTGIKHIDVNGTETNNGSAVLTIANGQTTATSPFLVFANLMNVPKITPLDNVGVDWWVEPLYTGSTHYLQIKTASAVSGDKRFALQS